MPTCTITRTGRSDEYGRPFTVGQSYTGTLDQVRSLVLAGYATTTESLADGGNGGDAVSPADAIPTSQAIGIAKRRIALGIVGQSNEKGQVAYTDLSNFPQAFQSIRKPSLRAPLLGQISTGSTNRAQGSWWFKFYDDMFDWGYDFQFVNTAAGNASLLRDYCGQVRSRPTNNSSNANPPGTAALNRAARTPSGYSQEDMGYFGDMTVQGGHLFKCTTGKPAYARYAGSQFPPNATSARIDSVTTYGSVVGAATDPGTWAAATPLGATVTDGSLVWTNIDDTNSNGFVNDTTIFGQNQISFGWDPFGLMFDLHRRMQAIQGVDEKWILIQNAQADLGQSQANYRVAMVNIAQYFLDMGYSVALGLSCWSVGASTANYDTLTNAVSDAFTLLNVSPYVGRVFKSANLYQALGSTGNMGTAGSGYLQADGVHLNGLGCVDGGGAGAAMSAGFKSFLVNRAT